MDARRPEHEQHLYATDGPAVPTRLTIAALLGVSLLLTAGDDKGGSIDSGSDSGAGDGDSESDGFDAGEDRDDGAATVDAGAAERRDGGDIALDGVDVCDVTSTVGRPWPWPWPWPMALLS